MSVDRLDRLPVQKLRTLGQVVLFFFALLAQCGPAFGRPRLIAAGESAAWRERAAEIIRDDFCEAVEGGSLGERLGRWA